MSCDVYKKKKMEHDAVAWVVKSLENPDGIAGEKPPLALGWKVTYPSGLHLEERLEAERRNLVELTLQLEAHDEATCEHCRKAG